MRAALLIPVLLLASVSASANPKATLAKRDSNPLKFKLQPGADGKLCLDCHESFKEKLSRPVQHTPIKQSSCVGCHNPHASNHGNLLARKDGQVCGGCHQTLIPASAKSVHKPAGEGTCGKCHDSHASQFPKLLLQRTQDGCASCHKELVESIARVSVKHGTLAKDGCTSCHDPHASARSGNLLKKAEPEMCLDCHKSTTPAFAKAHQGYPVAQAGCSTCHDPHGSNLPKMLRNFMHKPVAQKDCAACHDAPSKGTGLTVKQAGSALCQTCHKDQVNAMLGGSQVHAALAGELACLSCHDPHASSSPRLIDGKMTAICGTCHQDTIARHSRSPTAHPPVGNGQCSACHDPHSSENPMMLKQADNVQLCGTCHDWQKHSSHPLGDKVKDPRNQNMTMDCLSCHRAHGTEYKHMMPAATVSDLCTRCHVNHKR